MDINRFNKFVEELSKDIPIKVAYKDESHLMKVISRILFFNRTFMSLYVTTIGNTVYYPSKKWVEENCTESLLIMAHEYVHIKDNHKFGKIPYPIMYLFPQILAIFSILAVFAFATPMAWFFLLFLLFLAPIPSHGRKFIELRGYKMTLYSLHLHLKEHYFMSEEIYDRLIDTCDSLNLQFTGPSYYYMWPSGVKNELVFFSKEIKAGRIPEDDVYTNVRNAFEYSK